MSTPLRSLNQSSGLTAANLTAVRQQLLLQGMSQVGTLRGSGIGTTAMPSPLPAPKLQLPPLQTQKAAVQAARLVSDLGSPFPHTMRTYSPEASNTATEIYYISPDIPVEIFKTSSAFKGLDLVEIALLCDKIQKTGISSLSRKEVQLLNELIQRARGSQAPANMNLVGKIRFYYNDFTQGGLANSIDVRQAIFYNDIGKLRPGMPDPDKGPITLPSLPLPVPQKAPPPPGSSTRVSIQTPAPLYSPYEYKAPSTAHVGKVDVPAPRSEAPSLELKGDEIDSQLKLILKEIRRNSRNNKTISVEKARKILALKKLTTVEMNRITLYGLSPVDRWYKTVAVLFYTQGDKVGQIVTTSEGNYMRRGITAIADPKAITLGIGHAEIQALKELRRRGINPKESIVVIAASNGVCPDCMKALKKAGIIVAE